MTLYVKNGDACYVNMDMVSMISIVRNDNMFELRAGLPSGKDTFEILAKSDSESTIEGMTNGLFRLMNTASQITLVVRNDGTQFVPCL